MLCNKIEINESERFTQTIETEINESDRFSQTSASIHMLELLSGSYIQKNNLQSKVLTKLVVIFRPFIQTQTQNLIFITPF